MQKSTENSNPIVLVCAADDKYAMPLAVTMTSVALNHKGDRPIHLYILDGGISAANHQRIERSLNQFNLKITWIQPKISDFAQVPKTGYQATATYFRLQIAQLLPAQISRAIYLDCDLIVLADIEDLWHLDVSSYAVLAAPDFHVLSIADPMGLDDYQELGIPANQKYFNSGVLLMNLNWWRSENIGTQVMDYIEKYQPKLHDQDGLNAILYQSWGELDMKWNRASTIYRYFSWNDRPYPESYVQELIQNPYIIHFADAAKPWTPGFKHPEKHLFFKYLDQTAWSGWQFRFNLTVLRLTHKLKHLKPGSKLVQKQSASAS